MKLKAIKAFWMHDKKTARNFIRAKDEEFEIDHHDEAETVYQMLHDLVATVIDEKFIPKKAKYTVLANVIFDTPEGRKFFSPNMEIELDQAIACRLMVSRHVRPVSDSQWRPSTLLKDNVRDDKVKRMFDDEPETDDNWVHRSEKSGVRSGRD